LEQTTRGKGGRGRKGFPIEKRELTVAVDWVRFCKKIVIDRSRGKVEKERLRIKSKRGEELQIGKRDSIKTLKL